MLLIKIHTNNIILPFLNKKEKNMAEDNNDFVLYTVVRKELNLPVGKLIAQGQHSCSYIYEYAYENMMFNSGDFKRWKDNGHAKVVLGADDKEFKKIQDELKCWTTKDAGRTCGLNPGTETCLSLFPILKSSSPKIIKRLQLL